MTVHSKFRLRIVDIHPCPRAIVFSCHYLYNFRFRLFLNPRGSTLLKDKAG